MTTITGKSEKRSSPRKRWRKVVPPMTGIRKSRKITSGRNPSSTISASWPLEAVRNSLTSGSSQARIRLLASGSSSTISTLPKWRPTRFRCTLALNSERMMGLVSASTAPREMAFRRSATMLTMMTGIWLATGSAFNAESTSQPLFSGIIRSSVMRSGFSSMAIRTALVGEGHGMALPPIS